MYLIDGDRFLAEVELEPIQGSRFQPTGFPSLGAAEFTSISDNDQNVSSLLVESSQSMANRLEKVCWDDTKSSLVDSLAGLSVITINDKNDNFLTNSLLEAHRTNSTYIMKSNDQSLDKILKDELNVEIGSKSNPPFDVSKLVQFLFKYDPNTILHGVFLEKIAGTYRLTRALSSFIEAVNVKPVVSGGVKFDRLDSSGADEGGAKKGYGNIPYPRTEYSAESIKAYFNIDLALIRSYNLPTSATDLLLTFALWKIQRFLKTGLRLRTACDFKVKDSLKITHPENFSMPDFDSLDKDLKDAIKKCKSDGLFTDKPIIIKRST